MKKYLTTAAISCLSICVGFALCYLQKDHGAQVPNQVRACFNRSYPGCKINYATTPQIHIHNASEDKYLMVYRVSFRNLQGIPMSVDIFPSGRGLFEKDEAAY
jgi:hypothetical protein